MTIGMRMAVGLLLAGVLPLAGMLAASPARAQQAPRGTYLRTCPEVSVMRDTLVATCRRADGQWQQTTLANVSRCVGDIGNINGRLRCDYGPQPASLPGGSYRQSCTDITIGGATLSAVCRTRSGRSQRTALGNFDRCVGEISNNDGQLTCNRR